ncbi:MAG: type II toxin-antitoxin system VapC family toxin [Actinobacteria bacterium]|nr:MAG: type II toxin-antitoxin system VapC family toxin [Actinomycetota bacterium]
MTSILLDTSAYSAFLRGEERIKSILQSADEIVLTATVLGELIAGFVKGSREAKNRAELERFLSSERVRVVAVDAETAERYAVILRDLSDRGTPVPTNDIWIAASAMQHGLKIVTTDSHFELIRQVILER